MSGAPRTLVVTNDFPPRQGGIESFVLALVERLPPDRVVVYTSSTPGAAAFDAALPFPVVRDRARTLLPTPRTSRRAQQLLREHGCTAVLFGAAAPLGLLAGGLRTAGAARMVALTHGHETWWARLPGTRSALRRIGDSTDVLTHLGPWTRSVVAPALSPAARARMVRLAPGVDAARFRPGAGRAAVRTQLGLRPDQPVVACIARLTPRKGQDALVRAWPRVLRRHPDAVLLLVGGGPDRKRLQRLVASRGLGASVRLVGPVPWAELPPWFAAADVFAMPCRTRRWGLEPEALGIVYLEAAAAGLPVLVGDSGGAPDACLPGVTGLVVDGTDPDQVAGAVLDLLGDPVRAAAMGAEGRAWVLRHWGWDGAAARLAPLLAP